MTATDQHNIKVREFIKALAEEIGMQLVPASEETAEERLPAPVLVH